MKVIDWAVERCDLHLLRISVVGEGECCGIVEAWSPLLLAAQSNDGEWVGFGVGST